MGRRVATAYTAHGSRVTGFSPTSADGRLRSGVESHAGRFLNLLAFLGGERNISFSSAISSASERPMSDGSIPCESAERLP